MSLFETIRVAVAAVAARKLRSALTMLGILIGIASVMLTVGLGQGAQQSITSQINKLGSNMLIVTPGAGTGMGSGRNVNQAVTPLTLDDAAILADQRVCPDILRVAPITQAGATVQAGTTSATTTITGTSPQWLPIRAKKLSQGRFFTEDESRGGRLVAVIGSSTAAALYGAGSHPIGRTLTINGHTLTVIGVLEAAGQSLAGNDDDVIVIPSGTFASRMATGANMNNVAMILLEARDQESLSAAQQQPTATMLLQHRTPAESPDFTVSSQQALVNTVNRMTAVLTVLLSGLAAISLIVGGIGVMNIMLVSVTERIREIGLRKALGARPAVIMQQFLVEAGILGVLGGLLGIGLGIGLGQLISSVISSLDVVISPTATIAALLVSLAIGISAGVYPAWRAARLAPIDALRNE